LFYGFCHPLEDVMMPLLSESVIADLDGRRKSTALLQDMERLRGGEIEVPLCDRLPALSSVGEALGALYVMEGSTLGGSIIANMIRKRVPELPEDSLHFFTGYGPETAARWAAFKQQTDAFATTSAAKEAVILGANKTFETFHQWIKEHETTAVNG
jgi:heme oxygenase